MSTTKSSDRERCGDYEVICTINANRPGGIPVVILAAVGVDNPMRYQVRRRSTSVQFAAFREVQDYCRKNGWIK